MRNCWAKVTSYRSLLSPRKCLARCPCSIQSLAGSTWLEGWPWSRHSSGFLSVSPGSLSWDIWDSSSWLSNHLGLEIFFYISLLCNSGIPSPPFLRHQFVLAPLPYFALFVFSFISNYFQDTPDDSDSENYNKLQRQLWGLNYFSLRVNDSPNTRGTACE